ncbi:hypothetical protein LCGC14_2995330 [marine sediment metagenome]|uniref:LamG-like jellyroll fold domain-containing protein n=1 Tax=marine sediment metagenome TaxID=412755 RepID=A0A0F8ZA49_9ZZZZ
MVMARVPSLFTPKSLWSYNPLPTGCGLYLPLWSPSLKPPIFKSIDSYGHLCTVTGAIHGAEGYTFDGDDFISIANHSAIKPGNGTLIAWINPGATTNLTAFLSTETAGVGNEGEFYLGFTTTNRLTFILDDGAAEQTIVGNSGLSTGTDYHVAVTFGSGGMKLYQDAVLQADVEATVTTGLSADSNPILVGARRTGSNWFTGDVNAVWVFDRELSVEELAYHRNFSRKVYQ